MSSTSDPPGRATLAGLGTRIGRALFGDRAGLVLFLGCLCFVGLYWRVGVFITDTITLREGLDALAAGHLWIEPATGDYLSSPGTGTRNGLVYGRNYGQLVASLPALVGLRAIATVADVHVALVAVWHLLVLALAVTLGRLLGRQRVAALGGSALVLASFLANVSLVSTFTTPSLSLIALQATTVIAAGFVAVMLYRVTALKANRRAALLAGAGATVAMPVGFWASIPKRHVFTALVCVTILYLFARSREGPAASIRGFPAPAFRAGAYALVGLLAWIHAAEGLFVFLALVAVDVPTAPSNDLRTLSVVAGVFVLSLVPVVVTNLLVTGEFAKPPRSLYGGGLPISTVGGAGGTSGGSGGGGPLAGLLETITAVVPADWLFFQLTGLIREGLVGLTHTTDLYRTFVHSSLEGIDQDARFLGVNLAVLEAAPVLGAVGATVLGAARPRGQSRRVDATDALAVLLIGVFAIIYVPRLPLNTQITVRYLLPLYPLGAYLLVRTESVGRLLDDHLPAVLWSYAAGVLVGGQLVLAFVVLERYAVAEAARLHAILGFAVGLALAALTVGSVLDDRFDAPAAATLGLAAAAGTVFVLLSGIHYFSFAGEFVLPVVRVFSDLLAAAG